MPIIPASIFGSSLLRFQFILHACMYTSMEIEKPNTYADFATFKILKSTKYFMCIPCLNYQEVSQNNLQVSTNTLPTIPK